MKLAVSDRNVATNHVVIAFSRLCLRISSLEFEVNNVPNVFKYLHCVSKNPTAAINMK